MRESFHGLHELIILAAVLAVLFAVANFGSIKRWLIGRPMRTRELHQAHTKLVWWIALPILSADLYSSVAYGPEAGATELAHLGDGAKWLVLPITGATVLLLTILILSYIMGVMAYPNGGGAYTIARENFHSSWPALCAASALMVDYVLTVAVSVSSGVATMASSYPQLIPYETSLSVLCVLIILLVNLRGVSEAGMVFSLPTFLFMACMLLLVVTGLADELQHGFVQTHTPPLGTVPRGLTLLLLLKAFSAACSSLTGIETISNAVPVFRESARGAIKAYVALGIITGVTLLGFAYHLYVKGISVNPENTMLSQLAASYFGHGVVYHVIIWSTFIVLILAANSTFTGFPQLAALVAGDGFLPRALTIRGDRLGYSNGMLVLAALASLLIEVFHAQTNALIPLYSIGVFVAFTVAQLGLIRHWRTVRGRGWRWRAAVNTVGACVTALVSMVVAVTKFTEGAWMVLVVLPLFMWMAMQVRRHYQALAQALRIDLERDQPRRHHVLSVVLISGVHRVVLETVSFAMSISTDVIAVYVGFDDESIQRMEEKWEQWGAPCRLVTLKSEYRSLLGPLSRFIRRLEYWEGGKPDHVQILMPQFILPKWWQNLLHNQTSLLIRMWMLRHKDVVVTTVPYHLKDV
ncbi:MAG: amino acid permease [Thermoflavifilum sp.]|nr:amino acid permease [Thermoflavifilum sp.]MCL6515236.1 APC family permease [Alicyclobacillus sp.]